VRRVKITLPATLTNIGPGLGTLGLAVGLRASVELLDRGNAELVVKSSGTDAKRYPSPYSHPVVLAAMRLFQSQERAPAGFTAYVNNPIPPRSGLGGETALTLAGVIGAANLLDLSLSRDELLEIAAEIIGSGDGVIAAALGGLTAGSLGKDGLVYRPLAPAELSVVVVFPRIRRYANRTPKALNKTVPYPDALFHLSRLPMLIDAFQSGDIDALGTLLEDRIHTPNLLKYHKHYEDAAEAARKAGASGVSLTDLGPSLVAFTNQDHEAVQEAICAVFEENQIDTESWVLPVDRQGIVVSVMQS